MTWSSGSSRTTHQSLVAIASTGNLASSDKYRVRYGLQEVGASVDFTKNSLKVKSLEQLGPEAESLAPLLRGKTVLACGPAELDAWPGCALD